MSAKGFSTSAGRTFPFGASFPNDRLFVRINPQEPSSDTESRSRFWSDETKHTPCDWTFQKGFSLSSLTTPSFSFSSRSCFAFSQFCSDGVEEPRFKICYDLGRCVFISPPRAFPWPCLDGPLESSRPLSCTALACLFALPLRVPYVFFFSVQGSVQQV